MTRHEPKPPLRHENTTARLMRSRLLAAAALAALGLQTALACPESDPNADYNCPYGPGFVLPAWSNPAGWNEPEYYTTIQLGDVNGDGDDELLGRFVHGIEVYEFDRAAGQWKPQLQQGEVGGEVAVLQQFSDAGGWTTELYYPTIQLGDVDGDGDEELLGRFADGMRVFGFLPGSDGELGSWKEFARGGPFANHDTCADGSECWFKPAHYTTIQLADIDGNGADELIGRGTDGIYAYRWTGGGWTELARADEFKSSAGWDGPSYYSTIQFGNIDGQPGEELLARGYDGMVVWRYESGSGKWRNLSPAKGERPFSNGDGWEHEMYYSTIQLADVNGDGAAELHGRGAYGMHTFRLSLTTDENGEPVVKFTNLTRTYPETPQPFSNAANWDQAQYYRSIQLADVDADNLGAELLGRGTWGMFIFRWDEAHRSWWQDPDEHKDALLEKVPRLDNTPWADPSHYATLQTGDVDGIGVAELVGRGPSGIRTWIFDPTVPTWKRYSSYGWPSFDNNVIKAIDSFLQIASGTVVDVITDHTPDSSTLDRYRGCLKDALAAATIPPPEPCPDVAHTSSYDTYGVSTQAWTETAQQLETLLLWARDTVQYFDDLHTVSIELFLFEIKKDGSRTYPDLDAQLQIFDAEKKEAEFFYDTLMANAFHAVGGMASDIPGAGAVMSGLALMVSAMPDLMYPETRRAEGKFDEITKKLDDIIQKVPDQLRGQSHYIRNDLGLLATVGALISAQIWKVDQTALQSVGRQQFATWVHQMLLPVLWDRYEITSCFETDAIYQPNCSFPTQGDNTPVYDESQGNFIALLMHEEGAICDDRNPYHPQCIYVYFDPAQETVEFLWGDLPKTCDYTQGGVWEYLSTSTKDTCTLALDASSGSPIFNNKHGWKFNIIKGDPSPH